MSALAFSAGLALSCAGGGVLAWHLWPGRAKPVALILVLAWPLGLALTSSTYFLWLVVSGGRASLYPWIELVGLGAAALFAWHRARARRARLVGWRCAPGVSGVLALLALAVVAAVALSATVAFARAVPWGYWDAFARINLKARFLFAGGPGWSWIFAGQGVPHPDYPLLLAASVARLWCFAGDTAPTAPQVLSVANWLACLAALLVWTAHLRSARLAALAGLAFLCKRSDPWWAAMQYSDFVLAALFVCGAGLLAHATTRARGERWWPLLGACAGAAAWCKNEGLVYAALLVATALVLRWRSDAARPRARSFAALAAGLALGGAGLPVLKLFFAGGSSVFGPRRHSVFADLVDPGRIRTVLDYFARFLSFEFLGWALALLGLAFLLLPRERATRRSAWPLFLSAALGLVFFLVMLTTREELSWHLGTAADRLVLQLWPLTILGLVLSSRAA